MINKITKDLGSTATVYYLCSFFPYHHFLNPVCVPYIYHLPLSTPFFIPLPPMKNLHRSHLSYALAKFQTVIELRRESQKPRGQIYLSHLASDVFISLVRENQSVLSAEDPSKWFFPRFGISFKVMSDLFPPRCTGGLELEQ